MDFDHGYHSQNYIWVKPEIQISADTVSFLRSQTWTIRELIICAETRRPCLCPGFSWFLMSARQIAPLHPTLAALTKRGGRRTEVLTTGSGNKCERQMTQTRLRMPNTVSFFRFYFNSLVNIQYYTQYSFLFFNLL